MKKVFKVVFELSFALVIVFLSCKDQSKENTDAQKKTLKDLNKKAAILLTEKPDSALMLLNEVLLIDSNNFNALNNKIMVLSFTNQYPELLKVNRKLQNLYPENINYILQNGLINLLIGNDSLSNISFQKGLQKIKLELNGKQSIDIDITYIEALIWNDRYDEASEYLDKLKSKNPENSTLNYYKIKSKSELLDLFTLQ